MDSTIDISKRKINRIESAVPGGFAMGRSLPLTTTHAIYRYDANLGFTDVDDTIATEYALTIYVNDQEMATVVCSPEYLDDLVIGFLASEGVIRNMNQIEDLFVSSFRGIARVRISAEVNFNQEFYNKRYIASCCGKSRQTFYFYNDAHTAKQVSDQFQITPAEILSLASELEENAEVFHETGGVHVAALANTSGIQLVRSDIGRHNALDKIYGHAFRTQLPLEGHLVVFSGRLSSEVLLKVAKIGVGMVIAKSAPTKLAIDIANELHITSVGFVRGTSFNVYTHRERIAGC